MKQAGVPKITPYTASRHAAASYLADVARMCVAGAVMLLLHNHGSGIDPELEREAARREAARARQLEVRAEGEPQLAAQQRRPAIDAAPVHNHLHLHGIDADDMAVITRKALQPPDYK